jgi:integrase
VTETHPLGPLLAALGFGRAGRSALDGLDEAGWMRLLRSSDRARMTLLLVGLERPEWPDWVRARLRRSWEANLVRRERLRQVYAEIAAAFAATAVPHVVLKGQAHEAAYSADPRCRVQYDIDLYCPPESVRAALAVLEQLGYRPAPGAGRVRADHFPPLIRLREWQKIRLPSDSRLVTLTVRHRYISAPLASSLFFGDNQENSLPCSLPRALSASRQTVGAKPMSTRQTPIPIRPRPAQPRAERKTVRAVQAAIDELPLASGDWSVEGVPGLVVRCGARTKTYRLQRRIGGRLVQRVLGEMSLAQARRAALREWARLKPAAPEGKVTLEQAWERFVEERELAPKTQALYRYNLAQYLADWRRRTLEDVGADRAGVRHLCHRLSRHHGKAIASQVLRMLRAVYNYFRRIQPELPEAPTVAVDLPVVGSRDWALSEAELRAWWAAVERLRSPVKRMFWLTLLLTGARRGSVEALRWGDIDWERGTVHFATAKAGRSYTIPACRRLLAELKRWREEAAPAEADWVFPSPQKPGAHLVGVRDEKRGVASAHHLRHTYRTVLAELGATPDQARLLLGHSLGGDVSRGYITPHLVVESLRPLAEAVAAYYAKVLGWEPHGTAE